MAAINGAALGNLRGLVRPGLKARARKSLQQRWRAVKRDYSRLLNRAEHKHLVGRVFGHRNLGCEIGVKGRKRGVDGAGRLHARLAGQHYISCEGKCDAAIRSHYQLRRKVRTAGKIHRDFVAFADAVLFVRGRFKVAQRFKRIGLQLRLCWILSRSLRLSHNPSQSDPRKQKNNACIARSMVHAVASLPRITSRPRCKSLYPSCFSPSVNTHRWNTPTRIAP